MLVLRIHTTTVLHDVCAWHIDMLKDCALQIIVNYLMASTCTVGYSSVCFSTCWFLYLFISLSVTSKLLELYLLSFICDRFSAPLQSFYTFQMSYTAVPQIICLLRLVLPLTLRGRKDTLGIYSSSP